MKPDGKPGAVWIWGKYGVDCIKNAEGEWKFWHFTITQDFMTDYYHSWTDTEKDFPSRIMNDGVPVNDGPNTFFDEGYSAEKIYGMNPAMPVPYRTWSELEKK